MGPVVALQTLRLTRAAVRARLRIEAQARRRGCARLRDRDAQRQRRNERHTLVSQLENTPQRFGSQNQRERP